MDVLKQVFPLVGVRFVGSRHPLEGGTIISDGFLVEAFLRTHSSIVVSRSCLLQIVVGTDYSIPTTGSAARQVK
jgi:hypothetical protein